MDPLAETPPSKARSGALVLLVKVHEADGVADVAANPVETLGGRRGEVHEAVLVVPMEGVLP